MAYDIARKTNGYEFFAVGLALRRSCSLSGGRGPLCLLRVLLGGGFAAACAFT